MQLPALAPVPVRSDKMSDELSRQDKQEIKSASKDITSVLRGWSYEPGVINVRKIHGQDGAPKVQMRLDLGLLQMEMTGRPDGARPHGCESLLEYFEKQLSDHRRRNGTEMGFQLNDSQCASLREEAVQYYYRYLSLFVLEEFPGVVRDTARNLRVLDLCSKYADEEQDRLVLEQYRPYIIMMNSRAQASILQSEGKLSLALKTVEEGLDDIKSFFGRFGQEEAYSHSNEVRVLRQFARRIRKKLPVNPVERLRRKLEKAVKSERYEEAAQLRDKILRMQTPTSNPGSESSNRA
jgi:UvrB/uvrC motif